MDSPFVSVIIPTLNREAPLGHVLRYFTESQSYSHFELIPVDQSEKHEPDTMEYLRSLMDKVRLVQIAKKGAGSARNHDVIIGEGDDWGLRGREARVAAVGDALTWLK